MKSDRLHVREAVALYFAIIVSQAAVSAHNYKAFLASSISSGQTHLFGDWKGESLCQSRNTACRDEKVVYHLYSSEEAGKVTIRADKIVDGQVVTMGVSDWDYDREKQTLKWRNWRLTINGDRMDGTLTGTEGALLRKMWLKRVSK